MAEKKKLVKSAKVFDEVEGIPKNESKLYAYSLRLYQAMEKQAVDGIYEGKVVDTFHSLHISQSHYTTLFKALKELGCIELLDRGVRGRPTKYRMHGPPDETAFDTRYESGLTAGGKPARVPITELEQRISDIEGRLKGLQIKQVIVNHEERIVALEGSMKVEGGSK